MDASSTSTYKQEAERILASFRRQLNFNWQMVNSTEGITVMNCAGEDPKLPPIWLMQGIINAPLEVLAECCLIPENRHKWDLSTEESKRLVTVCEEPFVDIIYYSTKALGGGAVSSREFIDLRIESREEGRIIQAGGSIEYSSLPVKKGLVRAWDHPCGFLLERIDDTRSKLVCTTQVDLKGWLPSALVSAGTAKHLIQLAKDFKIYAEALAQASATPAPTLMNS